MEKSSENLVLTHEDLATMRKNYHIPAEVALRIPSADDKPIHSNPGEVCFHPIAFEYGLRLPIHPFIRSFFSHFGLAPSQVRPNVWRHIVGAIILWQICSDDRDHITLDEFNFCYRFKPYMSIYHLIGRDENRCLVLGCSRILQLGWHNSFFFATGSGCDFGPRVEISRIDKEKMKEPILSDFHMSRVNRALALDRQRRTHTNLITPENINKYLLNNVPTILSPSDGNASFSLNPRISPESLRLANGKKRRVSGKATVECPPSKKLVKRLSSRTQADSVRQPNPSSYEKPHEFPRLLEVESSSSESSVHIVDTEKKRPLFLDGDDLIFKRAQQLVTPNEIKQLHELGSNTTLQKSISYSAKAVAMMVGLCGQLELDNKKQNSKNDKTLATLQKTQNAYVDQLAATYMLAKDYEILKTKLAEMEKSAKGQNQMVEAMMAKLHGQEREIRAKDEQIKALKEAATNSVQKSAKTEKLDNIMAHRSQASSVPPHADWSSLDSISAREEKPKI